MRLRCATRPDAACLLTPTADSRSEHANPRNQTPLQLIVGIDTIDTIDTMSNHNILAHMPYLGLVSEQLVHEGHVHVASPLTVELDGPCARVEEM